MIEKIEKDHHVFAIILSSSFSSEGIHFFTPPEFEMQLGYMKRPVHYKIDAHKHTSHNMLVNKVFEVLFIKTGTVRVTLFDELDKPFTERTLRKGDVAMFMGYGHKFEMLEETEIIEVKQGPYQENKISIDDIH